MTSTLKSRRLSSVLPQWIKDWATNLIELPVTKKDEVDIYDIFLWHERNNLLCLLSDAQVAEDLSRMYQRLPTQTSQSKIKEFLRRTIEIFKMSENIFVATPSVLKRELLGLAKAADKLATSICEHERFLHSAADIGYLQARLKSDQPSDFSKDGRLEMKSAWNDFNSGVSLVDILETFADDVREEVEQHPQRIDGLDGSRDARIRYQIGHMKKIWQSCFDETGYAAIARMLTVLNQDERGQQFFVSEDWVRQLSM